VRSRLNSVSIPIAKGVSDDSRGAQKSNSCEFVVNIFMS
jgi:hypothetical protein